MSSAHLVKLSQNIHQVIHNEEFHSSICASSPDAFFDWKITTLFYCALHCLQALAAHRKLSIGKNHTEIFDSIHPRNRSRVLSISTAAFEAYDALFEYAHTARYDGFTDYQIFQRLKKADYDDAVKRYNFFREYVCKQGVEIKAESKSAPQSAPEKA